MGEADEHKTAEVKEGTHGDSRMNVSSWRHLYDVIADTELRTESDQTLMDRQKMSTAADAMETQTGTETQQIQSLAEMRDSIRSPDLPPNAPAERLRTSPDTSGNSLRPFYTAQKPACGFNFSWHTDHRRKHNDLQACNPAMWRKPCVSKPQ
ncbi:hypothetical protein Q8A67_005523 [Cirrhinus molitorella]|uniref:Uncharacterized protein n=1 Tax=Cirrhinus molitorella TaxID=172907 RepID=A0AA88PW47_9TELE|nr:hypothetical protein Q8A67_005523 [Cirrhinus molitorella]